MSSITTVSKSENEQEIPRSENYYSLTIGGQRLEVLEVDRLTINSSNDNQSIEITHNVSIKIISSSQNKMGRLIFRSESNLLDYARKTCKNMLEQRVLAIYPPTHTNNAQYKWWQDTLLGLCIFALAYDLIGNTFVAIGYEALSQNGLI